MSITAPHFLPISGSALKAEPLTRETASKTDENDSLAPITLLQLLGLRHRRYSALGTFFSVEIVRAAVVWILSRGVDLIPVQAAINAAFADDSEMLPAASSIPGPSPAPVADDKAKPARPGSARRKSQTVQEGAAEAEGPKPARVARPSSAKRTSQHNGMPRSTSKESLGAGEEVGYPEARSRRSSGSR